MKTSAAKSRSNQVQHPMPVKGLELRVVQSRQQWGEKFWEKFWTVRDGCEQEGCSRHWEPEQRMTGSQSPEVSILHKKELSIRFCSSTTMPPQLHLVFRSNLSVDCFHCLAKFWGERFHPISRSALQSGNLVVPSSWHSNLVLWYWSLLGSLLVFHSLVNLLQIMRLYNKEDTGVFWHHFVNSNNLYIRLLQKKEGGKKGIFSPTLYNILAC